MKRIVIVEDFNTSRQIIKKTLVNLGYQVDEASDGREAIKFFDGRKIDLLITDYNMPNMNGAELVEYVRAKDEYAFIPILMLSTETNKDKVQRAKEARITGWIKKPFQISAFEMVVKKALS